MGVDFRGYYASAQIAWQRGFAEIYNLETQAEYQSVLVYRCPIPTDQPPLPVAMPYLPLFAVIFLPLTALDLTTSYILWTVLNLTIFLLYLFRVSRALGVQISFWRMLQWGLCLPLIANLYLGQVNVILMVFLGEFGLAFSRSRAFTSGLILSALLVKPHVLILLLPGLILRRSWRVLLGFLAGSAILVGGSLLLSGWEGFSAMARLTYQFAGPLIQTAPTMMNWRSLALNLEQVIPGWLAWGAAACGAILIAGLVLRLWLRREATSSTQLLLLVTATYLGTLTVAWHSHFYMLVLLAPWLLCIYKQGVLPFKVAANWLLGPPLLYLVATLLSPAFVRNGFGLGMLAFAIVLLFLTNRVLRAGSGDFGINNSTYFL